MVVLGAVSAQVWVGQVRMNCGDHILFWLGIGFELWLVHGFCAPPLGGGGGGGRNSPLIQIVMLRIMTRLVRYCCDLRYSEFIILYIFLQ